ncbi:MAG TPA: LacI family DNA-binding transcriptional regulator [Casimicrobiaceae bacterium]|nr:LacI family DNA-binding transcriptional regulator [Casimicrobiaceae bacterium]
MPRETPPPKPDAVPARRRARLADVAAAAGVSTMTVVRVMRDPAKVARATRERVEAVLRHTGYTPDLTARGLASNRSGLLAAIVPVLTNSLIADIMQGLTDAVAPDDYHLLLGASGFSAAQEEVMVRAFLSRRVDGIYLTGVTHTPQTVEMLRHAGIPVVEGGNLTDAPIDTVVGYSNVKAARRITRFLLERGYAPVGYIGAFAADNDRARDRRLGYEAALKAARRAPDPALCVETTLDVDAGARALATLLERRPDVRAVFCSADAIAIGALFECQRRGLAIPGDIAIAGFDDVPLAGQVVPALTTIRVPRYEIGQRAGKLLADRLAHRPVRQRVVDTGFELVVRASA